jgi:lipid-A-disaccharide synthase-like uncharacterized protein
MKPGPVIAMIALIFVGMWLVLQPTLSREAFDFGLGIGAVELRANFTDTGIEFVEPARLADLGELTPDAFVETLRAEESAWEARPKAEQILLGFFNITSWTNFAWVAVGLAGQIAFFGRMMIQWVTSENKRESVVPELFWWLSLLGGIFLFTYFVWRKDVVGVLGQSTGVVIYARNLRLIHKQRKRAARSPSASLEHASNQTADQSTAPTTSDNTGDQPESQEQEPAHARPAG